MQMSKKFSFSGYIRVKVIQLKHVSCAHGATTHTLKLNVFPSQIIIQSINHSNTFHKN